MSDNYIVSARKYRPQTFDTVIGQEHITTTLKNAIKNQHLAHAYLFCGPRGVGKTTCARILAKTINCQNPTADMEACGVCDTCVSFKNNGSFNVFELDAASNNSVDDIRELTNQVRFAPQHGKYKVYIIDEVHMLSQAAFNAFLKTLEEPPSYAIFILATTEKHKILPTILSRCQIFDFRRITTHDITEHLQSIATKEGMVAQEAALHIIAQKSEGCMRDALSMLDRIASFTNGMLTYSNTMEHLNLLDADFYFRFTDNMLSQDVGATLLQLDQALEKGFEGDVIINGLAEHFRNLLLCKDSRMARLLDVPNDLRPLYNEKANQTPPSFILSALNVINDSELNYKTATNKRLHVEMCLIRLCFLLQSLTPELRSFPGGNSKGEGGSLTPTLSKGEGGIAQDGSDLKKNISSVNNTPLVSEIAGINTVVKQEIIIENQQVESKNKIEPNSIPTPPITETKQPPSLVATSQSTPPPSGSRRLSKNMLDDITQKVSDAATRKEQEKNELTAEIAQQLFDKYKQQLLSAGKNVIQAQFSMMRVEVLPPDEVRIISPSELTDTYAKEQRTQLIDFYRAETKMMVRITMEIQEDEAVKAAQNTVVLSKSEMFDAMAAKNPSLGKLKDALGMTIEY